MIQLRCQVVKAVFFAVCSECDTEGPEELSTQEAHESVIGLGWDYRTIYPEGHMMPVYTCSDCLAKKPVVRNPPIYATPIDPDCEISDADPGL
jgi:hypothetical protein